MRRTLLYVTPIVLALVCASTLLAAHYISWNSVDSGEIRYEDRTKYDDPKNWAIGEWNALGRVDILPDTWYVVADLELNDVHYDDVTWVGRYVPKCCSPDHIDFNEYYMDDGRGLYKQRGTATHEFGHALGLGDHETSDHGTNALVMYKCSACSGKNTPQSYDIDDYNAKW